MKLWRWSLQGINAIDQHIYVEQLTQLWQLAGWSVPGQLLGVVIISGLAQQSHLSAWIWGPPIALLLGTWGMCAYWLWDLKHRPITQANYTPWRARTLARGLAQSVSWGWLYVVIWSGLPEQWRTILFGAIMMWCFTALLFSMHDWGQSWVVCTPVTVLLCARLFSMPGQPDAGFVGWFMLAAVATGLALGRQMERRLLEGARSRLSNVELAQQLAQQVKKTENALELAEQASEDKSTFLAAASHDLRQPLHNLALLTGLLERGSDAGSVKQLGLRIHAALDALRSVFDQLFDVARLDAGKQVHAPQVMRLDSMVCALCDEYQVAFAAKALSLTVRTTSDGVFADPIYIQRILRNLLDNALRYTETGKVIVRMRRRGPRVMVQVWDTGPGIARALRKRIFNDYVQAHQPVDSNLNPGLGLGLGLVRRLVEQGQYVLTLRSRVGQGSCFSLSVPLCDVSIALGTMPATPVQAPQEGVTQRAPLIVIDDDLPSMLALRDTLIAEQWPHWAAQDLADVMTQVAQSGLWPGGVICDYRLTPRRLTHHDDAFNGLDVIREVRYEFGRDLPAWLLTADRHPHLIQECDTLGIVLLNKPINTTQLLQALHHPELTGNALVERTN